MLTWSSFLASRALMVGSVVFIHESEIAHLAHILPTSCLHCSLQVDNALPPALTHRGWWPDNKGYEEKSLDSSTKWEGIQGKYCVDRMHLFEY